jgi:hypothetical protein
MYESPRGVRRCIPIVADASPPVLPSYALNRTGASAPKSRSKISPSVTVPVGRRGSGAE